MLAFVENRTDAMTAEVLRQTIAGFLPHEYCGRVTNTPFPPASISLWAAEDATFAEELSKAQHVGADALIARCAQIADTPDIKADQKKLQIDIRVKTAGLWNPLKYGPQAEKAPAAGINALVNMNYADLSPAQKAQVDKFFGTDDD